MSVETKRHGARGTARPEALLGALEGKIRRVRVRYGYPAGLVAVTVLMLLLPLVYVALVALAGWAECWYAVHGIAVLQSMGSGSVRLALAVYIAPLAVGAVLLAFMIKPLFARRGGEISVPFTVLREEQPRLYAFVDRLCAVVGSRRPCRIDVDCDLNASAGFKNGLRGLASGQLVLRVGLPLVAGMDLRQLTGVFAHEFGHFAQGTGMRLTFLVRAINGWFYRVVYERDAWDDAVAAAIHGESHALVKLVALLAMLMVWLTRRVLWCRMWVAHLVSAFMLRQMEFDADRYEVRVVESEVFGATSERLAMLSAARQAAFSDLSDAWRERRLCDDLSKLIVTREAEMPAGVRTLVRQHALEKKTRWFESHPCDRQRIASVRREKDPGIFHAKAPATALFDGFEELSRRATMLFYRANLGSRFRPEDMVTTDTLVAHRGEQSKARVSLERFFQGLIHPLRPIFPDRGGEVPRDKDAAAEVLLAARSRLLERAPAAREAAQAFDDAERGLVEGLRARAMLETGLPQEQFRKAFRGLPADYAGVSREIQRSEGERVRGAEKANEAAREAMVRIEIALAMEARQARKAAPKDEYDLVAESEAGSRDRIVDAITALRMTAPGVENLRRSLLALGTGLSLCKAANNPESLVAMVVRHSEKVHGQLAQVHGILRGTAYPYEHAERGASLSRYALERMPGPRDVVNVYRAAESTLEAVYGLYVRLMSDLAKRAEAMEAALGLEPLPEAAEQPPNADLTGVAEPRERGQRA